MATDLSPKALVDDLVRRYRPCYQQEFLPQSEGKAFLVRLLYRPGAVLVDLGGGISATNGALANMGMQVNVVDLLNTYWEQRDVGTDVAHEIQVLRDAGVRFIEADLSTCDLRDMFEINSIDIVSSFHVVEHLHHSPRRLLESALAVLKPGGRLIIEVPNAANFRKRPALLFGKTNYQPFLDYFRRDCYFGHIREYTVQELHELAAELGMQQYRIFGKNYYGGKRLERLPFKLGKLVDIALQTRPALCGSLFVEMFKAA